MSNKLNQFTLSHHGAVPWPSELARHHSDEAIIELLMLAGCYRTVSYLVNGLRLPRESNARRFADLCTPGER
jgi:hypothetical protein